MFLRCFQSFNFARNLTHVSLSRCVSQTTRSAAVTRPVKYTGARRVKPILLANNAASPMKFSVIKRVPRKKPAYQTTMQSNLLENSHYNVCAYATADWYDLDRLKQHFLSSTNPFQLIPISDMFNNVVCIQISDQNPSSKIRSQVFLFDDGAVIFWNVENKYQEMIFNELKQFSDNLYPKTLVESEKEIMNFIEISTSSTLTKDLIKINCQSETELLLDKYTFSNALALSVKLGIWEALLDDEVEFVADLANRLKQGKHIKIEHGLMQRKSGELYSLKHAVNLSHDFLDTPDFYWSNSRLESLYKKVFNYFSIAKRTRVLNERLNFSLELISVIEASLNEKKHVRLEWIIITLICAEVFFNIIDHLDFIRPKKTTD